MRVVRNWCQGDERAVRVVESSPTNFNFSLVKDLNLPEFLPHFAMERHVFAQFALLDSCLDAHQFSCEFGVCSLHDLVL